MDDASQSNDPTMNLVHKLQRMQKARNEIELAAPSAERPQRIYQVGKYKEY